MEMLAAEAKVQFLHVPYKGMAPAFNDLLAGQTHAGLSTFASVKPFIDGGKVRGLAVTSTKRSPFAPQLPTTAEAGYPGFQIDFWWGLVAPARVPANIIKKLNIELNEILAQPDMREALAKEGAVPVATSSEEFGKMIAADVARWNRLVKERNIQTE
jgi:tripartite-type tricarboxylate transporter receptor subunit TctC